MFNKKRIYGRFFSLFPAALFCLALSLPARAQVTVTGTVTDKTTGSPLPGASVTVVNTFISTSADSKGKFAIRNLVQGGQIFRFSFIGYQPVSLELRLAHDTAVMVGLVTSPILGEEINITATRAQQNTPATYSSLDPMEIKEVNLGQDMPFILENTPSVVVTSDAGTGIGYTSLNIRGSDLTRINVTINGIPLNDAESQGVWFVDLPDLASSSDNIQVQRGVGTSTNGAGAFGASVNIQTTPQSQDPFAELNSSAGSFNSFKNTFRFGTGMMDNKFAFDGRISRITSDGYIDRAFSKLTSFYISGGYYGRKTTLKLMVMSGWEKTYQAWEGVPKDSLATNRTYNPAGEYVDANGNIQYYYNQTDNYNQTHCQAVFSQELSRKVNINAAVHYTKGIGYYENYKSDQSFSSYDLPNVIIHTDTVTATNLVNRKWLDNDFYGITYSVNYMPSDRLKFTLGGAWNYYYGEHYGKVIWAEYASGGDNNRNWYYNTGKKRDFNIFLKMNCQVTKKLNLFADLQYRSVWYKLEGNLEDLRVLDQLHTFNFFNPKAGVYFDITDRQSAYVSFGVGNREPNRNNYEVAEPDHMPTNETLYDLELGYNLRLAHFRAGANLYYMDYKDQLVLTGMINSVGEAIMTNVPQSYRAGIEITAGANIFKWLDWSMNSTFSINKIKDFNQYIDEYDSNYNFMGQATKQYVATDLSFSPAIIFQNSFSFKPVKNLAISLNSRFVGRQYIDNTSDRERSLDPWFVNGINASYVIHTSLIRDIGFNLMVNNLFSTKYETNAWVYPYLYNGVEYEENGYFPQALINFMLGITLKI
jgi:iron complex outermembrane recepter protein